MRETPLSLPPLPEQRAIARILGALDDKIELNRRQNATLEELADAPKTRTSTRQLPLPDVLVAALRAHRAVQEVERVEAGDAWQEHGLVFPSRTGTPTEPRNLVRHFKGALRAAGLPENTRFHDLRHSCATFLIAQGVHPRVVMEILGHSQIGITMDTYAHVLPETQRDAVEGIVGLFDLPTEEQPDQGEGEPSAEEAEEGAESDDEQPLAEEGAESDDEQPPT